MFNSDMCNSKGIKISQIHYVIKPSNISNQLKQSSGTRPNYPDPDKGSWVSLFWSVSKKTSREEKRKEKRKEREKKGGERKKGKPGPKDTSTYPKGVSRGNYVSSQPTLPQKP